jgi:ribosomal protein S18 acetylase RimI-like enzyme
MTVSIPEAELPLRAEANLVSAIKVWAAAAQGGELLERPGIIGLRVEAPLRAFNQAILSEVPSVGSNLDLAIRWFEDAARFRVRLREELARDHEGAFRAAGLQSHGGIPSLALSPIADTAALDVAGVAIRPVDETNLSDHVSIVQEAFDWEDRALATVFTERLLEDPAWHAFVAYLDGEVAATAQLIRAHDVAGLYYIGNRKACRERGLGEAITRHAVRVGAALGCDMASLQASPAGYPVYKRIGFDDVAYYRTFSGPD